VTGNWSSEAARLYHEATKYTEARDEAEGYPYAIMGDPANRYPAIGEESPLLEPSLYKIYTNLESIPLPDDFPAPPVTALEAIASTGTGEPGTRIDLTTLAELSLLSNGIVGRARNTDGRNLFYRASGGTGARYHLEIYWICADLPGLPAGIYHYAAHDHTFRRLREGDYRQVLADASGQEAHVVQAPVLLAITSYPWRNAWRYQERSYRHALWDVGTTFANLLAVAASERVPATVVVGYADQPVNQVLGIDGEREMVLSLLALGSSNDPIPSAPAVSPLDAPIEPISNGEIDFPLIRDTHRAANLTDGEEAARWRAELLRRKPERPVGPLIPLQPLPPAAWPPEAITDVVKRRRSYRKYDVETPLPFDLFSTVLDVSMRGFAADSLDPAAEPLAEQYLVVNNVEGLEPGAYYLHRDRKALELLTPGNWRAMAGRLAWNQQYPADAHVNVYYLANLDPILERYGNRGYRLAQIEAGIYSGKIHLATHALGLGAVASSSYDDAVTQFFSPHAAGKAYLFVIVFGVRQRSKPG
jgi:SagB-type dehydrogenase family enzyme